MRADRLLSLLMLLQTRGRMTAQKLAEELEVSQRTIYRDIEALSVAGVPIYADRGPGGGCALLDSYRTNLTGLTENEVRALFMFTVPDPLTELGVGRELKAALLKLSATLSTSRRQEEEQVRQRIHLDSVWWFQEKEPVPYLQTIQQAVWQNRKLHFTYRYPLRFDTQVEQWVAPYGLVAKAGIWYVVCARGDLIRAYRISRVVDARILDEPFEYPADFDLAAFWKEWCREFEAERPYYPVTVRAVPDFVSVLPQYFGDQIRDMIAQATPDNEGWIVLTLPFETLEAARERILGFGRGIEVLAPQSLRMSIQDFATQIVALYADG